MRRTAARRVAIRTLFASSGTWKEYATTLPSQVKDIDAQNPEPGLKSLLDYFKSVAGVKGKAGGVKVKTHPKPNAKRDQYNMWEFRFSVHPSYKSYTGRIYRDWISGNLNIEFIEGGYVDGGFRLDQTNGIYQFLLRDYGTLPVYVWCQNQLPHLQSVTGLPFMMHFMVKGGGWEVSYTGRSSDVSVKISGDSSGGKVSWEMDWNDFGSGQVVNAKGTSLEEVLDEIPAEHDSLLVVFTDPTKRRAFSSKFKKIIGTDKVTLTDGSDAGYRQQGRAYGTGSSKGISVPRGGREAYLWGNYVLDINEEDCLLTLSMEIPFRLLYAYSEEDLSLGEFHNALRNRLRDLIAFYTEKIPVLAKADEVRISPSAGTLHVRVSDKTFPDTDTALRVLERYIDAARRVTQIPFEVEEP